MVNWKKGLKRFGLCSLAFAAANSLYILSLVGADDISCRYTKRIDNSKLEQILIEERERAGIKDDISIQVIPYYPTKLSQSAGVKKIAERKYIISIVGTSNTYRIGSLRHELYHLAKGHEDSRSEVMSSSSLPSKVIEVIKYFYWYEPRAIAYTMKYTIVGV